MKETVGVGSDRASRLSRASLFRVRGRCREIAPCRRPLIGYGRLRTSIRACSLTGCHDQLTGDVALSIDRPGAMGGVFALRACELIPVADRWCRPLSEARAGTVHHKNGPVPARRVRPPTSITDALRTHTSRSARQGTLAATSGISETPSHL